MNYSVFTRGIQLQYMCLQDTIHVHAGIYVPVRMQKCQDEKINQQDT